MNDHNIFGLDIAVKYVFMVQMGDRLQHISDHDRCRFLAEVPQFVELFEELAIARQLEDDIHVHVVLVVGVELNDMRVLN